MGLSAAAYAFLMVPPFYHGWGKSAGNFNNETSLSASPKGAAGGGSRITPEAKRRGETSP